MVHTCDLYLGFFFKTHVSICCRGYQHVDPLGLSEEVQCSSVGTQHQRVLNPQLPHILLSICNEDLQKIWLLLYMTEVLAELKREAADIVSYLEVFTLLSLNLCAAARVR